MYEEITELYDEADFKHKIINLDLPLRKATMAEYEKILQNSSSIDKTKEEECRRLHESLSYLFNMKG